MKQRRWLPACLWVAIICWLSFSSLEQIQVPEFFSADKIGHIGMYAILGFLLFLPSKENRQLFVALMLFALLFAAATELIQHYFVTNRIGDWGDFIANCIGLSIPLFVKRQLQKT